MAGATKRAKSDPRRITARMLDEAFMEAVRQPGLAREAVNNILAVDENLEHGGHAIGGAEEVVDAVIDEPEEVAGTKWHRRAGRLSVNAAGNWMRAGRLLSLEY